MRTLSLRLLPSAFAIVRLPGNAAVPPWATAGAVFSVTRTPGELSVLCEEPLVPPEAAEHARRGWRALGVVGTFGFHEIGVVDALAGPLALAEIPILLIATYDTDVLLVHGDDVMRASAVLRGVGHVVADAD